MRIIFTTLALSFAAALTFTGCITNVVDESVQKVSTQRATGFTALKVDRSSDDISVTGWNADTIVATANMSIWASSSEKAKQIAQDLTFSWATNSTTAELIVTSDQADQELAHLRELTISAPSRLALDLETSSGDIRALNMTGDMNLNTTSGNITASTTGRIVANASSGDVTATCGRGASLDLSSGDVDLAVTSKDFDGVEVSTSSGDVTVRLADGAPVTLDLSTSSGDITVNYSGTSSSSYSGDLRMDINGGGKIVHLETSSGNIKVLTLR
ncbi:MAG: DUF4097 family beta strand repeat protein [Bacteroidetes bacterium]|nr:DUF4097 family beta strand repeat protein [Bacteroidota bacterium]